MNVFIRKVRRERHMCSKNGQIGKFYSIETNLKIKLEWIWFIRPFLQVAYTLIFFPTMGCSFPNWDINLYQEKDSGESQSNAQFLTPCLCSENCSLNAISPHTSVSKSYSFLQCRYRSSNHTSHHAPLFSLCNSWSVLLAVFSIPSSFSSSEPLICVFPLLAMFFHPQLALYNLVICACDNPSKSLDYLTCSLTLLLCCH